MTQKLKTLAMSFAAIAMAAIDVGREFVTPQHAYAGGFQNGATTFTDAHQARKSQFGLDNLTAAGSQKTYSERHAHANVHGEFEGSAHYASTDGSKVMAGATTMMAGAVGQSSGVSVEQRRW